MDGKITISKTSSNVEKDCISIRILDEKSGIEFVEARISLENFASAITGLSRQPCDITVRCLNKVGKKREQKELKFPMPQYTHNRREVAIQEARKQCPEGWEVSEYFNSQNSFFWLGSDENRTEFARTTITRWIEE